MSQRSAFSAAASATAEVSEPPRPSVVMRLSGAMPWKPATTATWPVAMRRISSAPSMASMRALPCAVSVSIGICQPCQERASTPMSCSAMASRPEVTCSPVATTASYSRASCSGESSWHQPTSWLVAPAMAETTTATWCPASTSRLTRSATLRMRSRSATEVPPNFITRRMGAVVGFQSSVVRGRRRAAKLGSGAGCQRRGLGGHTGAANRGQPWWVRRWPRMRSPGSTRWRRAGGNRMGRCARCTG